MKDSDIIAWLDEFPHTSRCCREATMTGRAQCLPACDNSRRYILEAIAGYRIIYDRDEFFMYVLTTHRHTEDCMKRFSEGGPVNTAVCEEAYNERFVRLTEK